MNRKFARLQTTTTTTTTTTDASSSVSCKVDASPDFIDVEADVTHFNCIKQEVKTAISFGG